MAVKLEGVIAPLLSPFTLESDELDVPTLRRHVDRLIDAGVHALIANAGTSEYFHLDEAERRVEAEVVVEQAAGRVPVLVGAGAMSTRASIAWAKHAESIGANGIMMTAPYYEPASVAAIVRHFSVVSESTSLPIMLYNNPTVAGVLLDPSAVAEIVSRANVPWIKLTTGRIQDVPLILDRVGDRAVCLEGADDLAFASMAMGSVGWVGGPVNSIPELALRLWRLVRVDHDLVAAEQLNRQLQPLFSLILREAGVYCSGLKELCRLRGYPLGTVRAPFSELDRTQQARMVKIFEDLILVGAAA